MKLMPTAAPVVIIGCVEIATQFHLSYCFSLKFCENILSAHVPTDQAICTRAHFVRRCSPTDDATNQRQRCWSPAAPFLLAPICLARVRADMEVRLSE